MDWKKIIKNKYHSVSVFLFFLSKRIKNDDVLRVASSLAYTSLVAIVPLFAIGLAIFSAFPVFEGTKAQIEDLLFTYLTPSFEQNISNYFSTIVGNAGQLTAIGVISITVVSILMLSTIESSFNFIFKVNQPRHITLGPLLLGTAFSMRGYLYSLQKYVSDDTTITMLFSNLIPPIMTILCLMMVYVFVPNKKVKFHNALLGAIVAVCLFWFLRQIFGLVIMKNDTYKTLYGALSVVPILLIWMYASWIVVMLGAIITASLEEFQTFNSSEVKKAIINNKKGIRTLLP